MTLAILCSGQGRQHPGMFALTGEAPQAASLFAQAARLLGGRDPREMVATETPDNLHRNRVGQILAAVQALAAMAALRDAMPARLIVAGYSVGEVAAWGVAGVVEAGVILDLVSRRAEAMDAASPAGDGLLFVRGLSRTLIDGLCIRFGTSVAIVNPGDAFVIGGARIALEALAGEARALNAARVVDVPVEVASHTARLTAASVRFRADLEAVPVRRLPMAGIRLLSGIDGGAVVDARSGLDKLAVQISQTVQWDACLQACVEAGATAFLELGPGPALKEMAAGAFPEIPARCLDDFRTIEGARAWLGRLRSDAGEP